jgi:hypothetical protein
MSKSGARLVSKALTTNIVIKQCTKNASSERFNISAKDSNDSAGCTGQYMPRASFSGLFLPGYQAREDSLRSARLQKAPLNKFLFFLNKKESCARRS